MDNVVPFADLPKEDKGGKSKKSKYSSTYSKSGVTGVTGVTSADGAGSSGNPENFSGVTGVTEDNADRPCYTVVDECTDLWRAGVWYHGWKASKDGPVSVDIWLCSPLHVDAVTCTDDGKWFGRQLRFLDTKGRWREWAMPMEMLRGSCEELRGELLAAGVHIDHNARGRLPDYLQWKTPDKQLVAALRTGWTADLSSFVLPDQVLGSGNVIYQSENLHHDGLAECSGDFQAWKDVASLCVRNPVLALSICVSLSGPLLARVQRDSGGLHWHGDSSTGKTTGLVAGRSVWGGETFQRTWRATANGLEGAAASLNDTCLALDEISQADPSDIGEIIYAIGNGTGKTRANRIGSARRVFRWRVSVLSTGEHTIAAHMAEGGKRPKAGQLVRLVNIPAKRTYGAFDDLHGFPDGRSFSDHIRKAFGIHYGYAGPAFVHALLSDGRDFGKALAEVEALPQFSAKTSQDGRVASRFALYGMTGELAIEWGILPWPEGEAMRSSAECYQTWLSVSGVGLTEDKQILRAVRDFTDRHGSGRFTEKGLNDEEIRDVILKDRAGWWTDTDDGRVYLFTSEALREAGKGYDFPRVLDAIQKAGWLYDLSPPKRSKATKIGRRTVQLYWVIPGDVDE